MYLAAKEMLAGGVRDLEALVALEMREIMDKMSSAHDAPKSDGLKKRTRDLQGHWAKVQAMSPDWTEGQVLSGPLAAFLGETKAFFGDFETEHQTRSARPLAVLDATDVSGLPAPDPVRRQFASEWLELDSYFNNGAHHVVSSRALEAMVTRLEGLLLRLLEARPADVYPVLDALIEQGEEEFGG